MESSSSGSPSAASGPPHAPDYVGFWRRFVAFLVDSLIVMVVVTPLTLALYGTGYFDLERHLSGEAGGGWDWAINIAIALAVILFWRYKGATPGKMAIGARIVDAKTGHAPSTGSLVARYVGYIVSAMPLMLGFVWIAIDRRKQGFHDKIAGTVVIYDED